MNYRQLIGGPALIVVLNMLLVDMSSDRAADENTLPPDSVYNLQVSVEDQLGKFSGLDRYRGNPVLVTMFYASCPHVCPLLISTIKLTESKLLSEIHCPTSADLW